MAETSEVQALEKISTEVDESQIKVILSTQCIKAQTFLADKLRKQAERSKETCNFISSANYKLQSEIDQAQREIKSLLLAQDTIKMANVELKKEWLIAKERKLDIIERVQAGEKKYEELWLESKARYESLPFVQKLLKAQDEVQNLKQQISKLENDEKRLIEEIETKKQTCLNLDRKRIIELAEFMVNEMPKNIKLINEKSAAIRNLTNEMENLKVQENVKTEQHIEPKETKDDPKTDNDWLMMPKLQMDYLDFDVISVKLDQVKIRRADHSNKTPEEHNIRSISPMEIDACKVNKKIESEEYISSFFKPSKIYEENRIKNYAKMKLINILEDIKVDKNEAQKMVANINPDALQSVDSISANDKNVDGSREVPNNEVKILLESEEVEEIDLTNSNADLLLPPTQFIDITMEIQVSQKETQVKVLDDTASTSEDRLNSSQGVLNTKKVSFDLPNTLEHNKLISDVEKPEIAEVEANETVDSQLNVSAVSDDGFAKIKDMIMKKHNLDLSPQFCYAKNIIAPLNLQKSEDDVVTSKFFEQNQKISNAGEIEKVTSNDDQVMEVNEVGCTPKENDIKPANQPKNKSPIVEMDTDADIVSSPKRQKIYEMGKSDKPVSGFLFGHGAQMITDFLDNSISTTGFEDGDGDFQHCIDSSLLLSPKADFPMPTGENQEVKSQDVPNFLSGLRKTGFSFFGGSSSSGLKPQSSASNQGGSGFSFSFGGEEKKNKGGLFSMFQ